MHQGRYIRLFIQAANIILMRPHNWESLALVLCRNMRPSNYTEIKPHSACKQACPDRLERAAKRHDMAISKVKAI
jgi:hypothetical protein